MQQKIDVRGVLLSMKGVRFVRGISRISHILRDNHTLPPSALCLQFRNLDL
jgi:hypothetical protein